MSMILTIALDDVQCYLHTLVCFFVVLRKYEMWLGAPMAGKMTSTIAASDYQIKKFDVLIIQCTVHCIAQCCAHNNTNTYRCLCVCLSPVSSNLQSILALPARFEWISKIIHCATLCMMLACLCIWHRLAYTRANNVFLVHFLTDYELFSCFGWFKPNTQWTNARMKCKNKLKQKKERRKHNSKKSSKYTTYCKRLDCLFGNWTKRVGLDINESKDDRTKETK